MSTNPIKKLLQEAGLNQSELQRELGLKTVTTVWRWVNEWNKHMPTHANQNKLINIAKKYGLSLTYNDLNKR